ncbi:MAG: LysR family transcriptional regulator [Clostridia bacterium]|nr:LysR family transcriptional regulator [Clostridia bacterium]
MVNLELYKIFYAVAKCGSLTKTAEQLYISQPAVSQSIKQLEGQLNTVLFNRTHRGMELSEHGGKLIIDDVEKALEYLEAAENKISEMQQTPTGTLRIGATDSIFAHVLPDRIVEYHEKFPQVKIELVTGTTPETVEQLRDSRVDVGFVNLPLDNNDVNCMQTVAHLNDVFVAGREYVELKGRKVDLEELSAYPLLMIEQNTVARKTVTAFADTLGVALVPDVEVASWDFMIKLAVRGMGVGCIPREYVKHELDSGELFVVDTEPALPARGIGLAVAKTMTLPYALKEFVEMFKDSKVNA